MDIHHGPARKTGQQRIFDRQQTAQLLGRDGKLPPPSWPDLPEDLRPASGQEAGRQPLRHSQSMGAAVRLKTCGFHNAGLDSEVESDPGFLPGAARLSAVRTNASPDGRRISALRRSARVPTPAKAPVGA